ncbi:hypothetical protein SEUCBS140593_002306 [Sporothrix eucalyptigena]|uniref:Solute carrier family 39 (Zinc transporter), member 1/2/3 n=1 Tax=Sporothrix eucalyptigena TaxID=1812306 RepID=A0ABP0B5G6_9PEZI
MSTFDPNSVNLTNALSDGSLQAQIQCFLTESGNQYGGKLGERIGALFVILVVSTAVTFFPVLAKRVPRMRIPLYVYLFARYFGSGVILATSYVHLLDPAYSEIGPASCVGLTGGWASYSWPPAIALASGLLTFLLDFVAAYIVEMRYGQASEPNVEAIITTGNGVPGAQLLSSGPAEAAATDNGLAEKGNEARRNDVVGFKDVDDESSVSSEFGFRKDIAAFLILEFGVLFHSVFIGLNLGVADNDDFDTLFPVLVFHQSFEGLGIGARLSAINIPKRLGWLPWILCLAYGLTTPIAIAIGLGVRNTYDNSSFTANVVNGLFDSISAGILMYTGFVEMIARDFLFDPARTNDRKRLSFMVICLFLGAGIMALVGKWA